MTKKRDGRGGRRAGAGRPATMDDAQKISLLIPSALLARVQRVAEQRQLSQSEAIRLALQKWVQSS